MAFISRDAFKTITEDVGPKAQDEQHTAWEREVLDKFEVIDTSGTKASSTT